MVNLASLINGGGGGTVSDDDAADDDESPSGMTSWDIVAQRLEDAAVDTRYEPEPEPDPDARTLTSWEHVSRRLDDAEVGGRSTAEPDPPEETTSPEEADQSDETSSSQGQGDGGIFGQIDRTLNISERVQNVQQAGSARDAVTGFMAPGATGLVEQSEDLQEVQARYTANIQQGDLQGALADTLAAGVEVATDKDTTGAESAGESGLRWLLGQMSGTDTSEENLSDEELRETLSEGYNRFAHQTTETMRGAGFDPTEDVAYGVSPADAAGVFVAEPTGALFKAFTGTNPVSGEQGALTGEEAGEVVLSAAGGGVLGRGARFAQRTAQRTLQAGTRTGGRTGARAGASAADEGGESAVRATDGGTEAAVPEQQAMAFIPVSAADEAVEVASRSRAVREGFDWLFGRAPRATDTTTARVSRETGSNLPAPVDEGPMLPRMAEDMVPTTGRQSELATVRSGEVPSDVARLGPDDLPADIQDFRRMVLEGTEGGLSTTVRAGDEATGGAARTVDEAVRSGVGDDVLDMRQGADGVWRMIEDAVTPALRAGDEAAGAGRTADDIVEEMAGVTGRGTDEAATTGRSVDEVIEETTGARGPTRGAESVAAAGARAADESTGGIGRALDAINDVLDDFLRGGARASDEAAGAAARGSDEGAGAGARSVAEAGEEATEGGLARARSRLATRRTTAPRALREGGEELAEEASGFWTRNRIIGGIVGSTIGTGIIGVTLLDQLPDDARSPPDSGTQGDLAFHAVKRYPSPDPEKHPDKANLEPILARWTNAQGEEAGYDVILAVTDDNVYTLTGGPGSAATRADPEIDPPGLQRAAQRATERALGGGN